MKNSTPSPEEKKQVVQRILDKKISQVEVAKQYGVTRQAVSIWVKNAKEGPKEYKTRGRPKQQNLESDQLSELARLIRETTPGDHGYEKSSWDLGNSKVLIADQFQQKYSLGFVDQQLNLAGVNLNSGVDEDDEWEGIETDISKIHWENPEALGSFASASLKPSKSHSSSHTTTGKNKRKAARKARKKNRKR